MKRQHSPTSSLMQLHAEESIQLVVGGWNCICSSLFYCSLGNERRPTSEKDYAVGSWVIGLRGLLGNLLGDKQTSSLARCELALCREAVAGMLLQLSVLWFTVDECSRMCTVYVCFDLWLLWPRWIPGCENNIR